MKRLNVVTTQVWPFEIRKTLSFVMTVIVKVFGCLNESLSCSPCSVDVALCVACHTISVILPVAFTEETQRGWNRFFGQPEKWSMRLKLSETIVGPIYYVFHLNTKPVLQITKRFINEHCNSNMVVFLKICLCITT